MASESFLFRLLMVAARKYSAQPVMRRGAARLILSTAVHLYAAEASADEAEVVARDAAQIARQRSAA